MIRREWVSERIQAIRWEEGWKWVVNITKCANLQVDSV